MVTSALLRDVANAVEREERADMAMRRGWPEPSKAVIAEWNAARGVAAMMRAQLRKELGR